MSALRRKALSLQDKMKILEAFDKKSVTKNQTQLAADLELPVSTLRTILKNRHEIEEKYKLGAVKRKKQRLGKFDKIEKILVEWVHLTQSLKLAINGPLICEKARKIAESLQIPDFSASNGWLDRFKNRHGIVYRQHSGEAEVAKRTGDKWMATLSELLQSYEPRNIFSADEFGLFFRLMPDESYALKDETCHGGKASKERLTILACANSDGSEKLPVLVIGQAKNPRSFENIKSLPVIYDAQPQAFMTELRFMDWLKALDNHFQIKCRHIILVIDNCPAHPKDVDLTNIKLVFLPPNATSKQPMNQGIIKVFKQGYRTRLTHRYLKDMEEPHSKRPLTVHDAILNIAAAWEAIKPKVIQNCFEKAGFRTNQVDVVSEEETFILQCFPDYSFIDDNIVPYEVRSIDDDELTKKEVLSDDDDDEEEPPPILSHAQALSAVNDLRRYLASLGKSEDALHKMNFIENVVIDIASKSFCQTKTSDSL